MQRALRCPRAVCSGRADGQWRVRERASTACWGAARCPRTHCRSPERGETGVRARAGTGRARRADHPCGRSGAGVGAMECTCGGDRCACEGGRVHVRGQWRARARAAHARASVAERPREGGRGSALGIMPMPMPMLPFARVGGGITATPAVVRGVVRGGRVRVRGRCRSWPRGNGVGSSSGWALTRLLRLDPAVAVSAGSWCPPGVAHD